MGDLGSFGEEKTLSKTQRAAGERKIDVFERERCPRAIRERKRAKKVAKREAKWEQKRNQNEVENLIDVWIDF